MIKDFLDWVNKNHGFDFSHLIVVAIAVIIPFLPYYGFYFVGALLWAICAFAFFCIVEEVIVGYRKHLKDEKEKTFNILKNG